MVRRDYVLRVGILLILLNLWVSCANRPAQAPVPGSIDAFDAYAFRAVSDAQAAITSIKTWQQCSLKNFPPTVDIDGTQNPCDPKAGAFPTQYTSYLNAAIQSYNIAQAAGMAYHTGASKDAQGLAQAITQLGLDVTNMLTKTAGGK